MAQKNKPIHVESINPNVRNEMRNARLRLEKTQKDMAFDMGLKESYVRFVENNRVNPSIKKMIMFEKYLGVRADILFSDLYSEAQELLAK